MTRSGVRGQRGKSTQTGRTQRGHDADLVDLGTHWRAPRHTRWTSAGSGDESAAAGASSFESRTPVGAERTDSSIRTTPTVTAR